MPRLSKSRSPARKNHLSAVTAHWRARERSEPAIIEGGQVEVLRLRTKVKDLQCQLRNERKRSKHAKAALFREREDKENVYAQAPTQDVEAFNAKLAEMEEKLEVQKNNVRALKKKVSRFPHQKKRALQRALCESTIRTNGSWLKVKMKSGRISTPARNLVRKLVLHHKISTSQAGGVMCALMNIPPEEKISACSLRRIMNEVGVGNKVRVAKVRKAVGK